MDGGGRIKRTKDTTTHTKTTHVLGRTFVGPLAQTRKAVGNGAGVVGGTSGERDMAGDGTTPREDADGTFRCLQRRLGEAEEGEG